MNRLGRMLTLSKTSGYEKKRETSSEHAFAGVPVY